MNDLKAELENVIADHRIKPVFQPIVSLTNGHILGHEALSRIKGSSEIPNTEELFELAVRHNMIWELEQICRKKSLKKAFSEAAYDKKLFLNVNPMVMHDIKFREGFTRQYLKHYKVSPDKIIFEVTERNAVSDIESFQGAIEHYKEQLYEIAVDDAGAGYSGLNLICDIKPHYIKLDMKLIRDIDKISIKSAMVKSMIELSHLTNIKLIAEGIETAEELTTLINLGVQFGQGYFIQRPAENFLPIENDITAMIKQVNQNKNYMNHSCLKDLCIKNLCKKGTEISPSETVENVFEQFAGCPELDNVCIVSDKKVLGILTRSKMSLRLSGRYGYSLNQKKKITAIMENTFLEVDYLTPINIVSSMAMERPASTLYDFIVITKNGGYYGNVTVKDLLQKATEIDIINAKHQNPLTGLPGNSIIEEELSSCVEKADTASILYFDIDNFKAFNDVYGFEMGDVVIKTLAETITDNISKEDFAGHIGGDDFVCILRHYGYPDICNKIIEQFITDTHSLYSDKDRKNGYIVSVSRRGEKEKFPLVSITISVLTNEKEPFGSTVEISEKLAKLKKKGKQCSGSSISDDIL